MWWPKSQLHVEFTRLRLSYTQPREKVFQALMRHHPCTEQAVIDRLQGIVARRTVQRTTDLFIEHKIAFKPGGNMIYLTPRFIHHGHILKCLECGAEIGYRDERIERAIERLAESRRFTPIGHSLTLVGACGKHA